jgi:hypothetical protein
VLQARFYRGFVRYIGATGSTRGLRKFKFEARKPKFETKFNLPNPKKDGNEEAADGWRSDAPEALLTSCPTIGTLQLAAGLMWRMMADRGRQEARRNDNDEEQASDRGGGGGRGRLARPPTHIPGKSVER